MCLCVWFCDVCELSQNKKVTSAQLRMHGLDPSVSEALTSPAKYDPYLSPSPSRLRIDAASAAAVGRSSSAAGKGPTPEVGCVMYPPSFTTGKRWNECAVCRAACPHALLLASSPLAMFAWVCLLACVEVAVVSCSPS